MRHLRHSVKNPMNFAERERHLMELKNTTLDDISSVIGFSATLRLVAWFGDNGNLYVPLNAEDGQLLVRLLGLPSARRLCETWPGEHVSVPRLTDYEIEMRRGAIARMLESGLTTRYISHILHISERRVQQMCREMEVAGLILPVGPPKARETAGEVLQKNWPPSAL